MISARGGIPGGLEGLGGETIGGRAVGGTGVSPITGTPGGLVMAGYC